MKLNLLQTVYLALAIVAFTIGVHQSMSSGIVANYWLFMLVVIFLMLARLQAKKNTRT